MKTNSVLDGQYEIQTFRTVDLTEKQFSSVVEQIKEMYLWFAPDSTENDMHERLRQHKEACIDVLTRADTGECCGFSVYYTEQFGEKRIMFRGGTIVRDRSRGLYKELLHHSVSPEEQDFVVAMTQNPRVYEALRSLSARGVAYPAHEIKNPEEIKIIAQAFCKAPGLNPESMIVPEVYGSIRKDQEFKLVKDHSVEKFFADNLGVDDGFLVVVPLH